MQQTINNKIRRGFSESARNYDISSGLHREIADKLFAQITREPEPSALLDVGCGTGYLTVKLKEQFSKAKIIGLDFSQGMLEVARSKNAGISWVLADGVHLPFADGSFDILTSNLAYQWAADLCLAFGQAKRVLAADGVLVCTLFGYNTCQELFQSLGEATAQALQFTRLPDLSRVREALATSGFQNPQVDAELIKIEFTDMQELVIWLRSIGANNLPREGYVGPEALLRASAIYHKKFPYRQGVGATFEVIRIYAKR